MQYPDGFDNVNLTFEIFIGSLFPSSTSYVNMSHALGPTIMKKLRSVHLYLGCIFAPLLLFFSMSGIWQTLGFHSEFLARLSSIHTSHRLKNGGDLTGACMILFVLLMAASFIITTILGVIMAIKHGGSRRAAYSCLGFGVAFPIALAVIRALGMRI